MYPAYSTACQIKIEVLTLIIANRRRICDDDAANLIQKPITYWHTISIFKNPGDSSNHTSHT